MLCLFTAHLRNLIFFLKFTSQVFCKDLTRDKHWEIVEDIVEIYNTEGEIDEDEN